MKKILMLMTAVFVILATYANNGDIEKKENSSTVAVAVKQSTQAVNISGSIVDKKSNEFLAGATIYINGNKYYSDLDGNFSVSHLKPGTHKLRVELISYQPSEMEIDIDESKNISIVLNQQ